LNEGTLNINGTIFDGNTAENVGVTLGCTKASTIFANQRTASVLLLDFELNQWIIAHVKS
jgi:hypothetical protein